MPYLTSVESMAEKVLVPVDGSEMMERTVKYACDHVKMKGGTMTLLHVVALPISVDSTMRIDYTPLERAGEKILKSAREFAEEQGCKLSQRLLERRGSLS